MAKRFVTELGLQAVTRMVITLRGGASEAGIMAVTRVVTSVVCLILSYLSKGQLATTEVTKTILY